MDNKYIIVKESGIHNKGVFARINIPKNTKIIEYIGEKISKEEGTKRENKYVELSKIDKSHGSSYVFELDDNYDLDGNVPENVARYINHSCNPNSKYKIEKGYIWIISIRDIKESEEISYNYGFEMDSKDFDFRNYKCKCGEKNCVGYILREEDWPKLKKL